MAIRVTCEACGHLIRAADQSAGRCVKCRCGAKVAVPATADDELEELPMAPRRTSPGRKRRGKSGHSFRLSFSPRLFKNLLRLAIAAAVCVLVGYAIKWGMSAADMVVAMRKVTALKNSTMAIIDPSTGRVRQNREAVEGLVRNSRALPGEEAVRQHLNQITAETNSLLNSLAAVEIPPGLVDGSEFVGAWRDAIREQCNLLETCIPPLVELRNDESREWSDRVMEVEIKLAEIRIKDLEVLLALLARHLEFYKKNGVGMSRGEVEMRHKLEMTLSGTQAEHRRLTNQLKNPSGEPVSTPGFPPSGLASAAGPTGPPGIPPRPGGAAPPPAGSGQNEPPRTRSLPDTPVTTVPVENLEKLKRGMTVWVYQIKWAQAEVLARTGTNWVIVRMTSGRRMGSVTHLPLVWCRIEESELKRPDLAKVPALSSEAAKSFADFNDTKQRMQTLP